VGIERAAHLPRKVRHLLRSQWRYCEHVTRGGGGDRVGGGQTDRSYPQVEVGASGLFGVARWGGQTDPFRADPARWESAV
jgi:hypothetical protein